MSRMNENQLMQCATTTTAAANDDDASKDLVVTVMSAAAQSEISPGHMKAKSNKIIP